MTKSLFHILKYFLIYLLLSLGTFLMLRIILEYTAFRDDVQFLIYKKDYLDNIVWKAAFYIHVFSASLALCAGFSQFVEPFPKRHVQLHRLMGRLYVIDIILINFPVGLLLAAYANGGVLGRTAFLILDVLWFYFTLMAFWSVRRRNFNAHKNYMILSYALTCSALTLRTWKMILAHFYVIDRFHLYIIDAWMGFVPNLLVACLMIRFSQKAQRKTL